LVLSFFFLCFVLGFCLVCCLFFFGCAYFYVFVIFVFVFFFCFLICRGFCFFFFLFFFSSFGDEKRRSLHQLRSPEQTITEGSSGSREYSIQGYRRSYGPKPALKCFVRFLLPEVDLSARQTRYVKREAAASLIAFLIVDFCFLKRRAFRGH